MGIMERLGFAGEKRETIENPQVPLSNRNILKFFGLEDTSITGEVVSVESALGIPAIWAAVNFLSGMFAGLPLQVFRKSGEDRVKVKGGINSILHDNINDQMSSFAWRMYSYTNVFTGGRAFTFIERNSSNKIVNLWPLDPTKVTVERKAGRVTYKLVEGGKTTVYEASEIIDIPFMLKPDMLSHYSPILTNRNTIGWILSMTRYGSKTFANGGVPPFVIEGPFKSPGAIQRSADDLAAAVLKGAKEGRMAISLPDGHKLVPIGFDAEKMQLTESQRFGIEQVARIYSMPPTFLQDLTHGTFSNTEQQDLHMVKHTAKRWIEQFEAELNLKLFGRSNKNLYVEMNLDGLLRGDFKSRIEGYSKGIQTAILTPNEARRRENLPDDPEGNQLLIQGATVPLGSQPEPQPDPQPEPDAPEPDAPDEEPDEEPTND